MKASKTLGVLIAVLGGCAPLGDVTRVIPHRADVEITLPRADLRPEVSAFSGTWEGTWDVSGTPVRLIVESIDVDSANVIYAWGDSLEGHFKAGWERITAKVLPGGILKWELVRGESILKYTFYMTRGGAGIEGVVEGANRVTRGIVMRKVEP